MMRRMDKSFRSLKEKGEGRSLSSARSGRRSAMEIAGEYEFVAPGKVAWTRINRVGGGGASVGLMAVPRPAADATDEIVDFLVYERGWRVAQPFDDRVRLRRIWRRGIDFDPGIMLLLVILGGFPGLFYLLAAIPVTPATGDLMLAVAQSDVESTILECTGRPYGRVNNSLRSASSYVWSSSDLR